MKKGILLGLALALMVLGTAVQSGAQSSPVLEKVWACPEVNHGDLLKVYIIGKDNDGDIRWVAVAGGAGKGAQQASVIRLKKADRKDLNGYVYWDTGKAYRSTVSGVVEVTLEDWKGNESETITIPVRIVSQGARNCSVPGEFKDKSIGPIMIEPADFTMH